MPIASEILKAQNNLKECYDVCKSVYGVVLPDDKNFDNLPALIEQALNPFNKPSDWSDIRKGCPANSIALYAGHTADYSQYDNLGFTATVSNSGQYKVYIDGTLYNTYASGSQCNITWSSLALTTGDDITTPTALKAHKIWISPATEGNNITAFKCQRVAASGTEAQGLLWGHFNLTNSITITNFVYENNSYRNNLFYALTAKNNTVTISSELDYAFCATTKLEYLPIIAGTGQTTYAFGAFSYSGIKEVTFKNIKFNHFNSMFYDCAKLEKINGMDYSVATHAYNYITNASNLKDTIIDMSAATGLKYVGIYGDNSHIISGLKGLRVSNEASFTGSAPQINVSYTGMDRAALVQLFNDLPTVSAGQIINITGCTGTADLTADDIAIAVDKGWTIME